MKTLIFSLPRLFAVSAHAGTVATRDYAANFNAPNNSNAKSEFSYGTPFAEAFGPLASPPEHLRG